MKNIYHFVSLFVTLFLLLAVPLTVIVSLNSEQSSKQPHAATTRDQYSWPFAPNSIWNLPLGTNAVNSMVPAGLAITSGGTTPGANRNGGGQITTDDEFIGLNTADPLKPLNGTQVHVPPTMSHDGSWNGVTAFLQQDNVHVSQGQPLVLSPGGNPSYQYPYPTVDITSGLSGGDDASRPGAHGGSGLSGFGGSIRAGEMTSSAPLHHALKINLDSTQFIYNGGGGHRWPAFTEDANANNSGACDYYAGQVSQLKMGALLALRPDADLSFIKSAQALKIAHALQDYGGYVVDSTCWNVFAFSVENNAAFGDGGTFQTDVQKILTMLNVVDSWNQAQYATVAASNGTQGAGGGAPRVAWAPPIGGTIDNPPTVSISSPSNGSLVSGLVNITATATDDIGVSKVEFYVDGTLKATDTSSLYSYTWDTTGLTGSHTLMAKAYDTSGQTATSSVSVNIGSASYLWCEGETFSLVSPMTTGTDSAASAGSYIYSPVTDVTNIPPTTTGSASLIFNIPVSGTYTFWSRVKYLTDATTNSYYAQFDGSSPYYVVGNDNTFGVWEWVDWHNGDVSTSTLIIVNLTAGTHTLKILGREANTFIDKICLPMTPLIYRVVAAVRQVVLNR